MEETEIKDILKENIEYLIIQDEETDEVLVKITQDAIIIPKTCMIRLKEK